MMNHRCNSSAGGPVGGHARIDEFGESSTCAQGSRAHGSRVVSIAVQDFERFRYSGATPCDGFTEWCRSPLAVSPVRCLPSSAACSCLLCILTFEIWVAVTRCSFVLFRVAVTHCSSLVLLFRVAVTHCSFVLFGLLLPTALFVLFRVAVTHCSFLFFLV